MTDSLRKAVERALETVMDPETGLSLPAMGLIYDTRIKGARVEVTMTTTTPGNGPLTGLVAAGVELALLSVPGVGVARVALTWDPPWDVSRIRADAAAHGRKVPFSTGAGIQAGISSQSPEVADAPCSTTTRPFAPRSRALARPRSR